MSFSNSTKAMPGRASTIRTSLNPAPPPARHPVSVQSTNCFTADLEQRCRQRASSAGEERVSRGGSAQLRKRVRERHPKGSQLRAAAVSRLVRPRRHAVKGSRPPAVAGLEAPLALAPSPTHLCGKHRGDEAAARSVGAGAHQETAGTACPASGRWWQAAAPARTGSCSGAPAPRPAAARPHRRKHRSPPIDISPFLQSCKTPAGNFLMPDRLHLQNAQELAPAKGARGSRLLTFYARATRQPGS